MMVHLRRPFTMLHIEIYNGQDRRCCRALNKSMARFLKNQKHK